LTGEVETASISRLVRDVSAQSSIQCAWYHYFGRFVVTIG